MTPWVLRLLIANILVFVLTSAQPQVGNLLALYPRFVLIRPWGVVTYMFVHANLMHILFNMIGLFFFGPRLEMQLGGKSFLWLYFLSGFGGALFSFIFSPNVGVVGASGAVFGVLLGFAYFWPKEPIYIWGVLPVQARILVTVVAVMTLYYGVTGTQSGTAHFAHLGGFAAAYLYLRWQKRKYMKQWSPMATPREVLKKSTKKGGDHKAVRRWNSIRVDQLHELNRDEVRRLLEKVSESGAASLTPDERAVLDRFSAQH